ncbi:3-hydroxyacyl-CoA dehydrogenase, partial [bacterium]
MLAPPTSSTATSAVLPPDPAAIRRVCVIGAGTMGSGIAAHLANLGFDVSLLDVDRAACEIAFARARSAKPSPFTSDWSAQSIRIGGIESDADAISGADWVVEAIVERAEAKRELYRRIEPLLGAQALVSTNTSGLEIGMLAEGFTLAVRPRFLGTHFFNPPRYLKLLELIPHAGSDPTYVETYRTFLEGHVARRVVLAKDTPGFIANRFGMWSIYHAIHCAERLQLSVEDTDAITGEFLGRPRSGTFRLADVIGIDVMADIARNLLARVPGDPQIRAFQSPRSLAHLLEKGSYGEKVGQGYTNREAKEFLTLDLTTYAYRPRREVNVPRLADLMKLPLAERLRMGLEGRDLLGDYLRMYLPPLLAYADKLRPEITHSVEDFDRVMRWGFGWTHGPFEIADLLGADPAFYKGEEQLAVGGGYVPRAKEPQYRSAGDFPVLHRGASVILRDFAEGVTGIGFTTKMGTINASLVAELTTALNSGDAI